MKKVDRRISVILSHKIFKYQKSQCWGLTKLIAFHCFHSKTQGEIGFLFLNSEHMEMKNLEPLPSFIPRHLYILFCSISANINKVKRVNNILKHYLACLTPPVPQKYLRNLQASVEHHLSTLAQAQTCLKSGATCSTAH